MSEEKNPDFVAQFQKAIRQGRYQDASRLLESGEMAKLSAERGPLALIEWARRLVLGQRAAVAARLAHLPVHRYGAEAVRQLHTWELEG